MNFLTKEQANNLGEKLKEYGYHNSKSYSKGEKSKIFKINHIRDLYYVVELRVSDYVDTRVSCINKEIDDISIEKVINWLEPKKHY